MRFAYLMQRHPVGRCAGLIFIYCKWRANRPLNGVEGVRGRRATNMGTVISVVGQKGGVGKTTTAVNLAAALAIAEKTTLLVDADPQGNATTGMGIQRFEEGRGLYHALTGRATLGDLSVQCHVPFLKIVPATADLMRAESDLSTFRRKESVLRTLLHCAPRTEHDVVIVDSPPSLGLLTLNAIVAADFLIIPLPCEVFALEGLAFLLRMVGLLKERFNPGLRIAGILLNMVDEVGPVTHHIVRDIRQRLRGTVFQTAVPRLRAIREFAIHGKPLLFQDARSDCGHYLSLAREVLHRTRGVTPSSGALSRLPVMPAPHGPRKEAVS